MGEPRPVTPLYLLLEFFETGIAEAHSPFERRA
jgi:hypothetical protein